MRPVRVVPHEETMRTVKLVVIGSSGVGKTSLRSQVRPQMSSKHLVCILNFLLRSQLQYISGRFTKGYRATIGADFITKTLPHYNNPQEAITLQIWVRNLVLLTAEIWVKLSSSGRVALVGHCWSGTVL